MDVASEEIDFSGGGIEESGAIEPEDGFLGLPTPTDGVKLCEV